MKEVWVKCDNTSIYEVSNTGRVRRINYIDSLGRKRGGDIVKTQINKYGYETFYSNKDLKNYLVHRLIITAFKGISDKRLVNHKNGIKTDNRVENLEWCTNSENVIHAYKNGLINVKRGSESPFYGKNNNHLSKVVLQIDKQTGQIVKEWSSSHEVKRQLGICNKAISLCCLGKGRRISVGGYKWKYKTTKK